MNTDFPSDPTMRPPQDLAAARDKNVLAIVKRIDELIHGAPIVSVLTVWVEERKTHEKRMHRVERPSLLEQIEAEVSSTVEGASGSGYESKALVNINAPDVQRDIAKEAGYWFSYLGTEAPKGVAAQLQTLANMTRNLEDAKVRDLEHDTRRWWGWARSVVGYDDPPAKPHVPCMNCEKWDTLRIQFDPDLAVCVHCREVWAEDRFGLVEWHYRQMIDLKDVRTVSQTHRPLVNPDGPCTCALCTPSMTVKGRTVYESQPLCPQCGWKRCPKAHGHDRTCAQEFPSGGIVGRA